MPGAYLCPGLVQKKITSPPPRAPGWTKKKQNSLIISIIVIKWIWKFREVIYSLIFILGVIVINLIICRFKHCWHLGIASLGREQGSFRSLQLFGSGPHQIQRNAAGVLQSLSEETVLRQPQAGPGHDSSAWYRARGVLGLTWYCVVCSGSTSFLSLCYRYWDKSND